MLWFCFSRSYIYDFIPLNMTGKRTRDDTESEDGSGSSPGHVQSDQLSQGGQEENIEQGCVHSMERRLNFPCSISRVMNSQEDKRH